MLLSGLFGVLVPLLFIITGASCGTIPIPPVGHIWPGGQKRWAQHPGMTNRELLEQAATNLYHDAKVVDKSLTSAEFVGRAERLLRV